MSFKREKTKNKYIGEYSKNEIGNWTGSSDNNTDITDNLFHNYVINLRVVDFHGKTSSAFAFTILSEKYFTNPFGYEFYVKENYENYDGSYKSECEISGYYEWDKYGYITYVEEITIAKAKILENETTIKTSQKMKIVYR